MSCKLSKITIACTDILKMTEFYSKVFNIRFAEHEFPGFKMYSSKITDINFLFCPNEIAGVIAEQNRHQFDYVTDNIQEVIDNTLSSGGSMHGELQKSDNGSSVTVLDPDGNTINFIQMS
ncbi:MAG: VOC family protein [Bacteroidetes bacterium]|nr:VOC family protein [Bacteroidota bacterium]